MYKLGDGVAKDLDKAKEFQEKAKEIFENLKGGFNPDFTA